MNRLPCFFIVTLAALGTVHPTGAQCPLDWIKTDGFPGAGVEPAVYAVTSWDPDGAGPQAPRLVAGGQFTYMADRVADSIAALNPETGQWEDLAGGVDAESEVKEQIIDEGTVLSLAVFQNDLIAGGIIADAGGVPVNGIARWDGTSWSPLGEGFLGFPTSMTVYNGDLIAAGNFMATGSGTTVNNIARWNGTSWLPLGTPAGMNGPVNAVAVYNGELIAVGNFTTAGGVSVNRIARWNGSQWQALGTGLNSGGFALAVLGSDLYVGGNFTLAGGVPQTKGVARWDGANWHAVGGGPLNGVGALVAYHGDIIAGGVFIFNIGGPQQSIGAARFDTESQTWGGMDGGFQQGAEPNGFIVHNDELIANGTFRWAGKRSAYGIASWTDEAQAWDRLAPGFDWTPSQFTTYRGDLIAAGSFSSAGDASARGVARWDGRAWHALGGGIGNLPMPTVGTLAVYNDELYVGGYFFFADGGNLPVHHIAKWNGDTETWSDVGGGVSGGEVPHVSGLAVYNGELVASGSFLFAGGVPVNNIARWNGSRWQPLGNGIEAYLNGMLVLNGELYVNHSSGISRWNGTNWQVVPGGPASSAMTVYNGQLLAGAWDPFVWNGTTWTMLPGWSWDPNGAAVGNFAYAVFENELIVAGQFENAAGIPEADGLVRFDGTSWHSLDTGNGTLSSITSALGVYNGELITNGRIEHPDGTMSNWRRWGSTCATGDLNGDGFVNTLDLGILLSSWSLPATAPGCGGSLPCAADINGDGVVNTLDLGILLSSWSL